MFVSHRQLGCRDRRLKPATCDWALDSGGFTEISQYGRWLTGPEEYVFAVGRYSAEIGRLEFAAPQDWMCEPFMLARTGLSVREHQERTVTNYLELTALAPELPFIPVLQGWRLPDYLRCVEMYEGAGVRLAQLPRVGLGSVCRRQSTAEIAEITSELAGLGLRLHGFGVKTQGLAIYGRHLASADSMAWSYAARYEPRYPGCTSHKTCSNCLLFASSWRDKVITQSGFGLAA